MRVLFRVAARVGRILLAGRPRADQRGEQHGGERAAGKCIISY